MRLVVDDQQILVSREFPQHPPHIGLVALGALFHHRALLRLERHQAVPVLDQDGGLIQLLALRLVRADRKLVVIIGRMAGQQHLQALFHRQPRRYDKNGPPKITAALRVSQRVQHLPGDDHRHHRRLAAAGRHLVAQALPRATIAWNGNPLLELGRGFNMPDQRFDGFKLTEVKRMLARRRIVPVHQQATRYRSNAGKIGRTPFINALTDAIDQFQLDTAHRIVARIENLIARRTTTGQQIKRALVRAQPVVRRRLERRVDDQRVRRMRGFCCAHGFLPCSSAVRVRYACSW